MGASDEEKYLLSELCNNIVALDINVLVFKYDIFVH